MCGICGIKGLIPKERNRHINNMLEVLCHRGPDEEGKYFSEDISLGIRRLSIIDLKTGSQPIYNEDKSLAIVCNGQIYNFHTLREDLIKKGHNFYTNSDIEAIVHLYEEYGVECLKYIKGMFSFALWDKSKKKLFIARDRFGIKPLYYYENNGIFAFSSELKGLFKLPFISKELNARAVNLYFSLEYVPSPQSIFKDVYKLKPAHYIIYENNSIEVRCYWRLDAADTSNRISFHEAENRLKWLLRNSIREHLVSDVPLGIFLSGGVDSSTLVALSKEFCNQSLPTFSVGFEEKSFDESKYAFAVSKYFGTEHHNCVFTIDDFINSFYNVINLLDEPIADLSIFPAYVLSKFSRGYIKVALSGEGADELFMGYPTYIAHRYANLFNKMPDSFKRSIGYLANLFPVSSKYFSFDFKLKQFIKGIYENRPIQRHILWMEAFSENEKNMLFNRKFRENRLRNTDSIGNFIESFVRDSNAKETYKSIQYLDIFTYLSEDLLVKSDRASMLSSLEVRVPYLDHKLVEFVWGLDYKIIYQKKLLKNIMRGIVPEKILSRPKQGFPIPFSAWLKNKRFFRLIDEYFNKDFLKKQGLFNYNYLDFLLKQHLSGKSDNRKKLRTYIMFQGWYRNWFK